MNVVKNQFCLASSPEVAERPLPEKMTILFLPSMAFSRRVRPSWADSRLRRFPCGTGMRCRGRSNQDRHGNCRGAGHRSPPWGWQPRSAAHTYSGVDRRFRSPYVRGLQAGSTAMHGVACRDRVRASTQAYAARQNRRNVIIIFINTIHLSRLVSMECENTNDAGRAGLGLLPKNGALLARACWHGHGINKKAGIDGRWLLDPQKPVPG